GVPSHKPADGQQALAGDEESVPLSEEDRMSWAYRAISRFVAMAGIRGIVQSVATDLLARLAKPQLTDDDFEELQREDVPDVSASALGTLGLHESVPNDSFSRRSAMASTATLPFSSEVDQKEADGPF